MIGESTGHYRITGKLGEGGMGEVYRATDSKLGREVAIKVLPAAFADDPDRMARFQREAQVLASLNHPNIAAIYGIEERAIVMELVEGETLKGPLPLETALDYAGQIADALEAAHEKGITHRDLKPANVKITRQGVVKVLDFGVAKIAEPVAAPGNPMSSPTLTMRATEAGVIMGTASYMAPEQARGQIVDKRADIWAFGVVLWEMLTGRRMFSGETIPDVLVGVLKSEPDLQAVPAQVRRLMARCLEKDPRKRLRHVADWRELLDEVPAEVRRTSSRLTLIFATALVITAATALWVLLWRAPRGAADRPFLQLDLEAGPDEVSQPVISPDGIRVLFASKGHFATRRLDQGKIAVLSGTEGASFPFFSPDGQWVAFFSSGKLQKMPVNGGTLIPLCDAPNGRGGSWGDDDNIIATLNVTGGLFRVPAAGGMPQRLTGLDTERSGVSSHRWPQVLSGATAVLFAATDGGSQGSLRILNRKTGTFKTLVENSTYGRYFGGYLVYYQRGTLFGVRMDPRRLELAGSAVPLVDGAAYSSLGRAEFDLSAHSTLVYLRSTPQPDRMPAWVYSSGKTETLLPRPGKYSMFRLSPDGRRLALSRDLDGKHNLWICDLGRETISRLTSDSGPDLFPVWSPDGEFVVFRSGNTIAWTRSSFC